MLFDYRWPTHGYEPTREAAMAAFAKSWRREIVFGNRWLPQNDVCGFSRSRAGIGHEVSFSRGSVFSKSLLSRYRHLQQNGSLRPQNPSPEGDLKMSRLPRKGRPAPGAKAQVSWDTLTVEEKVEALNRDVTSLQQLVPQINATLKGT